jgi:hypothetical protein
VFSWITSGPFSPAPGGGDCNEGESWIGAMLGAAPGAAKSVAVRAGDGPGWERSHAESAHPAATARVSSPPPDIALAPARSSRPGPDADGVWACCSGARRPAALWTTVAPPASRAQLRAPVLPVRWAPGRVRARRLPAAAHAVPLRVGAWAGLRGPALFFCGGAGAQPGPAGTPGCSSCNCARSVASSFAGSSQAPWRHR